MFEFDYKYLVLLFGIILWFIYKYLIRDVDFFEKRGVKYMKGQPLFGFMYELIFEKRALGLIMKKGYNQFSDARFFGVFEYTTPIYVIRDPELIKQIAIKDFNNFPNHRGLFESKANKVFSRNLFFMKDQKWRDIRSTLSPAFTGSKMRLMLKLIAECSKTYFTELEEMNQEGKMVVELKELFERYANDVIAKCAFGANVNSLKNRNNEFYKNASALTKFTLWDQIKVACNSSFPSLMHALKIKFLSDETEKFFSDLVHETIEYRTKNNIVIPDMIHLLMQAKKYGEIQFEDDKSYRNAGFATVEEFKDAFKGSKANLTDLSDEDIMGQCMVFMLAGFDTFSTAMHFLGYELALNQDIQEKLYQEIRDMNDQLEGEHPTYEHLQKMKYLDMVISESLRKNPSIANLDRQCSSEVKIQDYNGNELTLEPGQGVFFPNFAIHRDPKYYPDPEKFNPERFSAENRKKIPEFTYLPFGIGPRNCIGSRFALMEGKALIYSLLLNYQINVCSKTEIPLNFKADTFQMRAKNGVWVELEKRK